MGSYSAFNGKDSRIDLRVSSVQKALLEQAAVARGKKLSDFVIAASTEAAELTLADQNQFFLSEENMDLFLRRLEEPPQVLPGLLDLFARKSVFEE